MAILLKPINKKQQEVTIERNYPGLKLSDFQRLAKSTSFFSTFEFLDLYLPNDDKTPSHLVRDICRKIQTLYAEDFKQLKELYELSCAACVLSAEIDDISAQIDCLEHVFLLDVGNWDTDPVMLNIITKALITLLGENSRNIIFFARNISRISSIANNIAICMMWYIFYTKTGEECNMHRFRSFSDVRKLLDQVDVNVIETEHEIVCALLESISFLLNAIVLSTPNEKMKTHFSEYFQFENEDLEWLRSWCKVVVKKFPVNITDMNSFNNKLINDLLQQDLIEHLNTLLVENRSFY